MTVISKVAKLQLFEGVGGKKRSSCISRSDGHSIMKKNMLHSHRKRALAVNVKVGP